MFFSTLFSFLLPFYLFKINEPSTLIAPNTLHLLLFPLFIFYIIYFTLSRFFENYFYLKINKLCSKLTCDLVMSIETGDYVFENIGRHRLQNAIRRFNSVFFEFISSSINVFIVTPIKICIAVSVTAQFIPLNVILIAILVSITLSYILIILSKYIVKSHIKLFDSKRSIYPI